MATELQKRAVDKLVENSRNPTKTKGEVLLEVGYSEATAIKPTQVTKSKGFQEELKKYGLTEGLITRALVNDIKSKPKKRLGELNLGAEILGMKKEEKGGNVYNVVFLNDERAKRIARRILAGDTESEGTPS